jgi:hypothetical protein
MHGLTLEAKAKASILAFPKVKPLTPDKKMLLASLPRNWRNKVFADLQLEMGYAHWGQVPTNEILDRCFGIDLLLLYKGYALALDITGNWQRVSEKSSRFQSRAESGFFSAFNPDSTAVWYLSQPNDVAPTWLDAMCKEQRHGSIYYARLEHNSCAA